MRRGWMRVGAVVLWAWVGAASAAAPKAPEAAEAEAQTTAIMKVIKTAERAGFERNDGKRFFKGFAEDAQWIFGAPSPVSTT